MIKDKSQSWETIDWKSLQKKVFSLQKRIYKAVCAGDKRKTNNLAFGTLREQKLLLRSYAARMIAIRQVTQLNAGKKTDGIDKRVIELDIEKCFDRIAHKAILDRLIAPQSVKQGIFHCLKAGTTPEFPDQGTPQGGVVSPLLANIALNGIEAIHPSVRYADDMIFFLKPEDDAEKVLDKIKTFLAERGMKISEKKTKVTATTSGFDFLGWNFKVQSKVKFKSRPSKGNYLAMRKKVKAIVNCEHIGAEDKSKKLAPIIRGWRNYHKHCAMDKARDSLWGIQHRAWQVFNKEESLNEYQVDNLVLAALPTVSYSENKFVNVQGEKSPYDGDLTYWSERNSKLYDGATAKALKKQHNSCGQCGLKLISNEKVHLHHIDGNHKNWKPANLRAVHESCHDYIHMSKKGNKP